MAKDVSKEDFETAVLENQLKILSILATIVAFQEKMGEAIAMLAGEMGYSFEIKEDAEA